MVHFGVQLLEMVAQGLFKFIRYQEVSIWSTMSVITFQSFVRVILSPIILVMLMRRGRQARQ